MFQQLYRALPRGLLQLLVLFAVSTALPLLLSRRVQRQMRRSLGIQDDSPSQALLESVPPTTDSFDAFTPGPEIWVGSIVALVPIVWATIEFTSRIRVQQQCLVCRGSGLVYVTKSGNSLSRARKCWNCGGFLPWLGWRRFFLSTFDVGNGGVLQRPSADYDKTQATWGQRLEGTGELDRFDGGGGGGSGSVGGDASKDGGGGGGGCGD